MSKKTYELTASFKFKDKAKAKEAHQALLSLCNIDDAESYAVHMDNIESESKKIGFNKDE